MQTIEYTFNELENEAVWFNVDGKKLVSMGGPEKTLKPGVFWSPAMDADGVGFDLYWYISGSFGDSDFYKLQDACPACL